MNLTPNHGQKQNKEDVGVSQKTPVAIRVNADSLEATPSIHSDTIGVSVSLEHRYKTQSGFQVEPDVDTCPKVFRASRLHFVTPEELYSIFLHVTQTLQTPIALQGPFSETLSRTVLRPHLVLDQKDRGSSGNPTPSIL